MWTAAAGAALALSACGSSPVNDCENQAGVTTCGEFGEMIYVTFIGEDEVQWPPVVVDDGGILLATNRGLVGVGVDGSAGDLGNFGPNAAPPSLEADGSVLVVAQDGGRARVSSFDRQNETIRWALTLSNDSAGTPPAVDDDTIHTATTGGLDTVDVRTGAVTATRPGATGAAILPDGSLRYLEGEGGCGLNAEIVAEDADGKVMWRHAEGSGIADFAPGPDGATYIVTGDRNLVRVSALGQADWQFDSPCADCTIAAAPTITEEAVYFPVWEGGTWDNCGTVPGTGIDPLYALSHEGGLFWEYDGFHTGGVKFSPTAAITNFGAPVESTKVKHHPSGRPAVAEDGTLYVASDGSVAVLNRGGELIGRAIWDAEVGETFTTGAGLAGNRESFINPGVTPSPVLGDNGILYVWDGFSVRAFDTGKTTKDNVWIAPFGGASNQGRVQ
jgi:hypothetical protein